MDAKQFSLWLLLLGVLVSLFTNACTPRFGPSNPAGWLGADAAYSVKLDAKTLLWLFGDTFYQPPSSTSRGPIVANSVALSHCRDNQFVIQYILDERNKHPTAFFRRKAKNSVYWPKAGIKVAGRLLIFLERIQRTPGITPLGFKEQGSTLAIIDNPSSAVSHWHQTFIPINTRPRIIFGVALVKQGSWLYTIDARLSSHSTRRPLILSRFKLTALLKGKISAQYLTRSQGWSSSQKQAKIITQNGALEASFSYNRMLKRYLLIYSSDFAHISLQSTTSLEGPYTKPRVIYTVPEMLKPKARQDKVFCYAGKAHPYFTQGNSLLLTYVCNSFDPKVLIHSMRYYWPTSQWLTVNLTPAEAAVQ